LLSASDFDAHQSTNMNINYDTKWLIEISDRLAESSSTFPC
jgi:hypothetical protein